VSNDRTCGLLSVTAEFFGDALKLCFDSLIDVAEYCFNAATAGRDLRIGHDLHFAQLRQRLRDFEYAIAEGGMIGRTEPHGDSLLSVGEFKAFANQLERDFRLLRDLMARDFLGDADGQSQGMLFPMSLPGETRLLHLLHSLRQRGKERLQLLIDAGAERDLSSGDGGFFTFFHGGGFYFGGFIASLLDDGGSFSSHLLQIVVPHVAELKRNSRATAFAGVSRCCFDDAGHGFWVSLGLQTEVLRGFLKGKLHRAHFVHVGG
jgi:hypothetical protein